jgi:glycosyltransferase involved in cell wall biosynthesis
VKLLVFAHKPPPHHGQSYMVQLLLQAFGGDAASAAHPRPSTAQEESVVCYHVDCRLSESMEDIGRGRVGKLLLLLKYCGQAISYRYRFGVENFFYIPAPPVRAAIYRDWIVMLLCRPFFRRRIYYWQAAGLGEWLHSGASAWERWLTRALLGKPDLSIVLGEYCRPDAAAFHSRRTEVVPNGVPDPCPEFETEILPSRTQRTHAHLKRLSHPPPDRNAAEIGWFKFLFLSLCTREKGLFDTLEAIAILNRRLAQTQVPVRAHLSVAGKFWRAPEQTEFEQRIAQADLNGGATAPAGAVVRYWGFVAGEEKARLFRQSDCFCFPTYYQAESFGIVLIEAMAFGLPIITTRWRTIPELLPPQYFGLVNPRSPGQIAAAMENVLHQNYDPRLRMRFLAHYTIHQLRENMKTVLQSGLR